MRRALLFPALGLGSCLSVVAASAWAGAADEPVAGEAAASAEPSSESAEPAAPGSEKDGEKASAEPAEKKAEATAASAAAADPYDPTEIPEESYAFIGMRFRNVIVPKFILSLFADGGATVNAFTFGPEFVYRRDHLEFDLAISYSDYSMDPFMFKGKDDGVRAFERVWSDMKVLYFTVDVMYEWPIDDGRFGFALGGGVGIGIVFDKLYRHQVYPFDPGHPDPDNPDAWGDCQGAGSPDVRDPTDGQPYCDDENDHFPSGSSPYVEPSWAHGGSRPFVFPWISLPGLSFRFKPIKQLQTRLDTGFSITGFYVGLAAHYGL